MKPFMPLAIKLKTFDIVISVIGGALLSFFIEIWAFLAIVVVLVFADLLTGVRAAVRNKQEIQSKKIRTSVAKIKDYMIAIMLAELFRLVFFVWALDGYLTTKVAEQIPITFVVAFIIGWAELKSNLENIEKATGVKIWHEIEKRFKIWK